MREYTEYEREAYGIPEPTAEVTAETETETPMNEIETPIAEVEASYEPEAVETISIPDPLYKSKKFIEVEDESALFAKLQSKYGHTSMSPEEKAIAFLRMKNPELEDKDIAFLAETEYGIGAEEIPDDELDNAQRKEIQMQNISRKKLAKQADDYFTEQATQVTLDGYDPLDLDPDYQAFRGQQETMKAEEEARQLHIDNINTQIDTNVKAISEITENVEIELDESKLAIPIKFKLNEDKQKELANFAKRYTPTQAEYDTFNDTETGKFDFKGYMESLAPIAFAKDIAKAGMRQALAQDRQQFIEKELKNSTLRNNDVSQTVERKVDAYDYYFDNIAGR